MTRSCYCNDVREGQVGQRVTLCGWVNRRRDHGGVTFIDLRDRTGIVQIVFSPERQPEVHEQAHDLRSEYVLRISGSVAFRPDETKNTKLPTGMIEVNVDQLSILNRSQVLPFQLDEEVGESIRLLYRFLDLRRPEMQHNLTVRHRLTQTIRTTLDKAGFLEIETPMLTRSTPEGARDYLVPSRVHGGQFYALPQSPQLFKQLLMIAGYDRYFQIARCFRDEDLRADRQPEFTQIDMEMSFVEPQDVMAVAEQLMARVLDDVHQVALPLPIPRLTYAEAMARYGLDAPDIRIPLELTDLTDAMRQTRFKVFAQIANQRGSRSERGMIKVLRVPGGASLTRKQIDEYTRYVAIYGAKGLAWIKINAPWQEGGWQSPIVKFFSDEEKTAIAAATAAETGDILFFGADQAGIVHEALGRLRVKIGQDLNLTNDTPFSFVWVTEFPLLDWDSETRRHVAVHHPFTAPMKEDMAHLDAAVASGTAHHPLDEVRSQAYDLVLNGTEIGGGSIRIHAPEQQQKMLGLLGIDADEAGDKFGFLLNALDFGAPPHGGIAFGLDRLAAILLGAESIRDVIAFPKTQKAACSLTQAPSLVDPLQLRELNLRSTHKPKPSN